MKILFVVTDGRYFYSHRLPMARAARRAGLDVAVATRPDGYGERIADESIRVVPFPFDRASLNPFRALLDVGRLWRCYRRERPDIVHHVAMKPVLFGSIAAALSGVPRTVNAFPGLGYVFTSGEAKAALLRRLLVPAFAILSRRKGTLTLFQNGDDRDLLTALGAADPERSEVIRGSGVDTDAYAFSPLPPFDGPVVCVYAGRMIGIKGLATLREAFAMLKDTHPHVRLWLCGAPDECNPASWREEDLEEWGRAPNVDYKGACDMKAVWPQAHLAVQASWGGEGVPKSLLEAAACGRPIVATDVPGCRETVVDNGLLVPPRDARALAEAIGALASDPARMRAMGRAGRALAEGELSARAVMERTEALYRALMKNL